MWLGSVYILITFFLTVSSSSLKYMAFPKDLLILALPSIPGILPSIPSGYIPSGSTKTSPYVLLKLLTTSLACSNIGFWSLPTGTKSALKAVISAA